MFGDWIWGKSIKKVEFVNHTAKITQLRTAKKIFFFWLIRMDAEVGVLCSRRKTVCKLHISRRLQKSDR